jgi:hypothetical protein
MKSKFLLCLFLGLLLFPGSAFALYLGSNITINDRNPDVTVWQEDGETEPGMVNNQSWDLEAFFLDGSFLSLVGGYDFENGQVGNGITFRSGDIFIDIDGDAVYGANYNASTQHNAEVFNTFGYDYVFDMNFSNKTYDVIQIDSTAIVSTTYYAQNQGSNPWQYVAGGSTIDSGNFEYMTNEPDFEDLKGGNHNIIKGIDLSKIGSLDFFIATFTMECGNDNIVGSVPEPATIILIGTGLLGIAGFGRKKLRK